MTNKKFEPHLIGVAHEINSINKVLNALNSINPAPKTIGIEAPPIFFKNKLNPFWVSLKNRLELRGITVKLLLTDSFDKAVLREVTSRQKSAGIEKLFFPELHIQRKISEKRINGKLSELLSYTLPKIMLKKALQIKPDVIICGAAHAPILRTNLKIPKNKFQLVSKVPISMLHREIIRVRRFERTQKTKMPRIKSKRTK